MYSRIFLTLTFFFLVGLSVSEQITSGWVDRATDDPEIVDFANRALKRLNANQTVNENQYKILKILDAKLQLVSGKNYMITFQVGLTNCLRDVKCPENAQILATKNYQALIYSQPWTNTENYTFSEQQQKREHNTNGVFVQKECPFLILALLIFITSLF